VGISFSDSATGWSFVCATDAAGTRPPPGGLVLTEMQHDGHNFCRDLRMIGIRIWMEEIRPDGTVAATTNHFLPLSDPPFTVGTIQVLQPSAVPVPPPLATLLPPGATIQWLREAAEVGRFSSYFRTGSLHIAFGLRCDFTLPNSYVTANWPNCEIERLEVSQRFLFAPRTNTPPHEPSGGLQAARCHPTARYTLVANPAVDRTRNYFRVGRMRFDYRLHLFLDRHHSSPSTQPSIGNNAGLFADHEAILGGLRPTTNAFTAVEKPLVLEVATMGLDEGTSLLGPRSYLGPSSSTPRGWDNVHWWGTRGPGQPIISAPGAFHAAHIHWRWGGAGSTFRSTIPEIDGTGAPSGFKDRRWGVDRLQVDPNIWMQTIRVAVTKNDGYLNPNSPGLPLSSLCPTDWDSLFTGLRATPQDIEAGDDIVLWYSADIPRTTYFPSDNTFAIMPTQIRPGVTYTSTTPGTVFLHGIFFAHDAEGGGLGSTSPEHFPRTPAQIRANPIWKRTW